MAISTGYFHPDFIADWRLDIQEVRNRSWVSLNSAYDPSRAYGAWEAIAGADIQRLASADNNALIPDIEGGFAVA